MWEQCDIKAVLLLLLEVNKKFQMVKLLNQLDSVKRISVWNSRMETINKKMYDAMHAG